MDCPGKQILPAEKNGLVRATYSSKHDLLQCLFHGWCWSVQWMECLFVTHPSIKAIGTYDGSQVTTPKKCCIVVVSPTNNKFNPHHTHFQSLVCMAWVKIVVCGWNHHHTTLWKCVWCCHLCTIVQNSWVTPVLLYCIRWSVVQLFLFKNEPLANKGITHYEQMNAMFVCDTFAGRHWQNEPLANKGIMHCTDRTS